jgi:putative acetyltransferase
LQVPDRDRAHAHFRTARAHQRRDPIDIKWWFEERVMTSCRIGRVEIRPATIADAVAIIDLHFAAVHETAAACYPREVLDTWSPVPDEARYNRIRSAITKGEELFVVAEDGSKVVGFGSILPSRQELHAVYVHPKVGRRGVGSRILLDLERLAVERGVMQLQMAASVNAEGFYQRAGYEVIERSVLRLRADVEMACVYMNKRLTRDSDGAPTDVSG